MDVTDNTETRLRLARDLVEALESGDEGKADGLLGELASNAGPDLFRELGRLTRELHDSLNSFVLEGNMAEMAHVEMPDASERLRYVITVTEQAANTTLSAIEDSMPLIEAIKQRANELDKGWSAYKASIRTAHGVAALDEQMALFMTRQERDILQLQEKLSDVLVAQGFQDLTGQIIRKVISLVQDVEVKLIELVRISGHRVPRMTPAANSELAGPAVPGVSRGDHIQGQDDVHELLSGLGF